MYNLRVVLIVLSTFPNAEVAGRIARQLVESRLVACVNLIPSIRSIYEWEGEVCDDAEVLGVIKTARERLEAVRAAIVAEHPYDVPEVVAIDVDGGHQPYLDWVMSMTSERSC